MKTERQKLLQRFGLNETILNRAKAAEQKLRRAEKLLNDSLRPLHVPDDVSPEEIQQLIGLLPSMRHRLEQRTHPDQPPLRAAEDVSPALKQSNPPSNTVPEIDLEESAHRVAEIIARLRSSNPA